MKESNQKYYRRKNRLEKSAGIKKYFLKFIDMKNYFTTHFKGSQIFKKQF